MSMAYYLLNDPHWFAGVNVEIYDLGLSSGQVLKRSKFFFARESRQSAQAAQQMEPDVRNGLSSQELEWLDSGRFVELESIAPQRLLKTISQGINGVDNFNSVSSVDLDFDPDDTYTTDVYIAESFG